MADKYSGFHERVSEEVDPERGIDNELERIFRDSDTQPTRGQKKLVRNYYATGERTEKITFSAGGREYVKTGENEYRRVDKKDEVTFYNPQTGYLYVRLPGNQGFRRVE